MDAFGRGVRDMDSEVGRGICCHEIGFTVRTRNGGIVKEGKRISSAF